MRSSKSIKSTKELAEELFSPEGQKRNDGKKDVTPAGTGVTNTGEDYIDDEEDDILKVKKKMSKIEKINKAANLNVSEDSMDNSLSKDFI